MLERFWREVGGHCKKYCLANILFCSIVPGVGNTFLLFPYFLATTTWNFYDLNFLDLNSEKLLRVCLGLTYGWGLLSGPVVRVTGGSHTTPPPPPTLSPPPPTTTTTTTVISGVAIAPPDITQHTHWYKEFRKLKCKYALLTQALIYNYNLWLCDWKQSLWYKKKSFFSQCVYHPPLSE